MDNFLVKGPFGELECIVEPNRSDKNAVLVMAHGFHGTGDCRDNMPTIAYAAACCCDVVRFNFTKSRPISDIISELHAVIDKVKDMKPGCSIYLLGRSLGGGASIITAFQDKEISRLILISAMNDINYTFRYVMGAKNCLLIDSGKDVHYEDERGKFTITPQYMEDLGKYDITSMLSKWHESCPVLLLHCEGDKIVRVWQAKKNAELLGEKGELRIFPNGDHSLRDHIVEAEDIIAKWLKQDNGSNNLE